MKCNKNENVCERNFDGRFSGELCWEIVQQYTSEGPMNCFEGLSNIFASEGCPIFYRNSVVCFQEQIAFVLKTVILLAFGLGICEGISEDSRHGFGHVDIRVCS